MKQQNRFDRQGIPVRLIWVTKGSLQHSREKNPPPIKKLFGLLFGMHRSLHAIETRLHEERKACKKL
jgi:LmbE family N-acetylglucosaminyl deacetylase